jgi:glycosyltransferase involved in cell wall biosynthesis
MPKLSIIIPTFNASASIERCLRSIINQTFTDYEVVIQDGGSLDKTIELVRAFQRVNGGIEIQLHQERDKGVYDAMNKAIHRANGEWLYFLGSDDELYEPHVLSRVMGSRDAALGDVLYGNVKVIGNARWAIDGAVYDGHFDLKKLLTRNICHQAMFYKAEFVRTIGNYNIRYVVCADWDFNMRCWSKTAFKYIDVIVAKFYAGGISTQDRLDEQFAADVAANVVQYFSLSISDPLINTPAFVGYGGLVRMQHPRKLSWLTPGRVLRTLVRRLTINRSD